MVATRADQVGRIPLPPPDLQGTANSPFICVVSQSLTPRARAPPV